MSGAAVVLHRSYAPPRRPATSRLPSQLALVLAAALLYFLVRGLTESADGTPMANARHVLRMEAWLGIDIEAALQRAILDQRSIVTLSNWVYIWGHWPVIVATLVWFHRTDGDAYVLLRNALFASGAIGLVVFAAFPVAPPRLYDPVYVDTVTELSRSYRVLQPPALVNKYAAMPSLHVGWNFLVGLFLARRAAPVWIRRFGAVSPVLMVAAVVLTANHYVLDAVAGIVVAAAGLRIAEALAARRSARGILGSGDGSPKDDRDPYPLEVRQRVRDAGVERAGVVGITQSSRGVDEWRAEAPRCAALVEQAVDHSDRVGELVECRPCVADL